MSPQEIADLAGSVEVLRKAFAPTDNPWIPAVAAIGGALVGAIATLIPTAFNDYLSNRRKKALAKAAVLAEISALVKLLEARDYVSFLSTVIKDLQSQPVGATYKMAPFPESNGHAQIFKEFLPSLGLLEADLGADIVRFYYQLEGVLMDFRAGGALALGARVEHYQQVRALIVETVSLGKSISVRA